jgi:predicted metal-dependent hydrolase
VAKRVKLDPSLEAFVKAAAKPKPEPQDDPVTRWRKGSDKKPAKSDLQKPALTADVAIKAALKLTREEWLMKLTREHFADLFEKSGRKLPAKLRISCGWPSTKAMGAQSRRIGECWYPNASSDGHTEIFISPILADAVKVGDVLAHELVHACLDKEAGHGPRFKELAKSIGLEGKMTETHAGDWLKAWLEKATTAVGPYPHSTLDGSQRKKQTTRLLKVVCANMECEYLQEQEANEPRPYTVRMSATVFEAGAPKCGCCGARMDVAETKARRKK